MADEQKYRQTQSMERGIICRFTNIKSKLEKNKRMIDKQKDKQTELYTNRIINKHNNKQTERQNN